MKLAALIVTGACGAGKTTLTLGVEKLKLKGVTCYILDYLEDVLPSSADTQSDEDYQSSLLEYWVSKLLQEVEQPSVAIIDAHIRPHLASQLLHKLGVPHDVVMVDCDTELRHERLRGRGQPELINSQMDGWAAYLRGQADALGLTIIDNSVAPLDESISSLRNVALSLLKKL